MSDPTPGDEFWNLVAAYIDAVQFEDLRRSSDPALMERVVRHVQGCEDCQARLRAVLRRRNAGDKKQEGA